MPQRTPTRPRPTRFTKSCLATAIAALAVVPSACSTLPAGGDVPRDDALVEAGLDTRDTGERNWNQMMYLLGFSEEAKRASRASAAEHARGGSPSGSTPLLDEVDWALMEEDAPMPASDAAADVVEPAFVEERIEDGEAVVVVASTEEGTLVGDMPAERTPAGSTPAEDTLAEGTLIEETPAGEAVVDASELRTGSQALSHEVGDSETLWDIAKAATGDATNWHVLADVNDLEPDAAVYPGQILTIPADLVRPEPTADASAPTPAGEPGDESNGVLPSAEPTAAAALPVRDFELDADETLWDLARRATGDATNWRAIADANGFTDREASLVRPGQPISVPLALVRDPLAERAAPAAAATSADGLGTPAGSVSADEPLATASATGDAGVDGVGTSSAEASGAVRDAAPGEDDATVIRLPDVDATGPVEPIPGGSPSSEPLQTGSRPATPPAARSPGRDAPNALGDERAGAEGTLRIVDAAYRGGDAGTAIDPDAPAATSEPPAKIMVSGTYYPKAVYNDADFSSSLLMRVSPGTTLQVSRAVGPWFEVQTEQGRGYVHARDIK